jgi:nucleolar protein 12
MSSLLGSIFGGGSDDKKNSSQSLFEKSKALPDRPQHKTKAASRKKIKQDGRDSKKEEESGTQVDNGVNDAESPKREKKKRKKRKVSSNNDSGGDAIDNEKKEGEKEKDTEENQSEKEKDEERTIFVGNLPLTITRKVLAALFRDCGPIASCRIRSVPVSGIKLPKDQAGNQRMMRKVCVNTNQIDDTLTDTVQGYVVFKNLDDVAKALELNNKLDIDGVKLRVDRSKPTVDPSRSVFVGNLPYATKESTLQEHFEKGCLFEHGDVLGVRIVRDKETFQCKGFGYVLFSEKNAVPAALKLHDSTYMKKKIRVMVCGKRFKGRKGEPALPPKEKPEKKEKISVGAFRRIIGRQQRDVLVTHKRKRGEKKKNVTVTKAAAGGVSKRAALDKKVDAKVKKLQKRAAKGMGKNKR